ncbi:hypothetical protein AHAS_Ahas20G0236700 [Arachis hypogaea]
MVRGRTLQFRMEKVREIFKLPPSKDDPHSFNRRVQADLRLDQVLKDICLPISQWKRTLGVAKVQIDRDIFIAVDNPITKKSMEHTRKLGQAPVRSQSHLLRGSSLNGLNNTAFLYASTGLNWQYPLDI